MAFHIIYFHVVCQGENKLIFCYACSQEKYSGLVGQQNNNNNNNDSGSVHVKMKSLLSEIKKLVLLCQYKLHMKQTTSLSSVIQQYQVQSSVFLSFIVPLKRKIILEEKINIKKYIYM